VRYLSLQDLCLGLVLGHLLLCPLLQHAHLGLGLLPGGRSASTRRMQVGPESAWGLGDEAQSSCRVPRAHKRQNCHGKSLRAELGLCPQTGHSCSAHTWVRLGARNYVTVQQGKHGFEGPGDKVIVLEFGGRVVGTVRSLGHSFPAS
jgi:hypothetical protein